MFKRFELKTEFFEPANWSYFVLSAPDVARLYKYRWGVALFFKLIKHHLKVKSFWGYSYNAIRVQIYTTIIVYVTVAIMKEK